jgi:tRNA A-37 threonylcarbamoyl transferase component Bud32
MGQVDTVEEPKSSVASAAVARAQAGPDALDRPDTLGPYRLVSVLGRGGMATVYRARDERLGRDVAVKLLLPHLRRDASALRRFVQEARAVAKLRHEGIVAIFDVASEDAPEPYIVVELVRGGSLREVLRAAPPMPPEIAADLALDVLEALDHAHAAGIVHRDIKPENVLIDEGERSGGGARAKLADFGIAKMAGQQTVTNTGELVGSPAYMAPEQLEGAASDARSDVFAVGVMLYECMAGRRPFEGDGAAQVIRRIVAGQFAPADERVPSVGSRWSAIAAKALAHDREARYPSARAFADALREERARLAIPSSFGFAGWLRAPEATATSLAEALAPALLASARSAQRAGDPLALAADVNRLLALYPAHPEGLALLMDRSRRERRTEVMRRAAGALGAAVAIAAAWGAIRARGAGTAVVTATDSGERVEAPSLRVAPRPEGASSGQGDSPPSALATGAAEAGAAPQVGAKPSLSEAVRPSAARSTLPERVRDALAGPRSVVVESLQPPFGVVVRVDDGEATPVAEGSSFAITPGRHVLQFGCKGDACIPQEIVVSSSESVVRARVALRIRPARLRILAAPERRFQLLEVPAVELRLGEDVEVPMRGSRAAVHLVDLATGKKTPAMLTAGVVTTVSPE